MDGIDPCCTQGAAAGAGSMITSSEGSATVDLTLISGLGTGVSAGTYRVDVYASNVASLRGYEIALDVYGGKSGGLTLQDLWIDAQRSEFVFGGADSYPTVDKVQGRLACVELSGGVPVSEQAYLGTFVFQASPDAKGDFTVVPRSDDGTILFDALGNRLELLNVTEASISRP